MSSPEEVVILSLTPGDGAVAFTTEAGVEILIPPSIELKLEITLRVQATKFSD